MVENVSYNWPYDFFSLVELVKLDSEIMFADLKTSEETLTIAPKVSITVRPKVEAKAKELEEKMTKGAKAKRGFTK